MNWRQWHKKVSLIIAAPLVVVVMSGIMLQFRNQIEWIQPQTVPVKTQNDLPFIGYVDLLNKLEIKAQELDQVIYRPKKNIIYIRFLDGMEWQVHPQTAEVLKKAERRTAFLIDLHQGSIIGPVGQYGVYLITSFGLLFLLISGIKLLIPRRRV